MITVVEWTAPCPSCGQPATWRSRDPGLSETLAPLTSECPSCDRGIAVWTEPPTPVSPERVTAPRALACIARRMLFGGAA